MSPQRSRVDPKTVLTGADLLYRWWLQSDLGVVPKAFVRQAAQATVICPDFSVIASDGPARPSEAADLESDTGCPAFVIAPGTAPNVAGFDLATQTYRGDAAPIEPLVAILAREQAFLAGARQVGRTGDEFLETTDAGNFQAWGGKPRRLVLSPAGDADYAYTLSPRPGGDFFFRSRSVRPTGRAALSGSYKRSRHALTSGTRVLNLDLILGDSAALLRLVPAGAGYKVFQRELGAAQLALDDFF